jgi:menaquinone-9 beta-reductase
MSDPQDVDLLIIGSGPAGLSTALHLLKQDKSWAQRMLILEKESHPRPKLCGGGITRLGIDLLQDLGFKFPLPIPQALVDDVRFTYQDRTIHVRGKPQLSIVHRADFDAYLAQSARSLGAVIKENEAVQTLERDENCVHITSSKSYYQAKAVVIADGSKGIMRRMILGHSKPSKTARLLEVLTPVAENLPLFVDRYAQFDFTAVKHGLQGYTWVFPSKVDGSACLNQGVYDARITEKKPEKSLPQILMNSLHKHTGDSGSLELKGHPIHWFSPTDRFSLPRILFVGDAAGVDPLFGEGISPALAYGKIAAGSMQRAFQKNDFSFRDYRRRILISKLGRYLILRWCIAVASYRLSGNQRFMHALWTFGDLLARKWPQPKPKYENI